MPTRLDRALALRDSALRILGAVGQVMTIGDKRHSFFDAAPWRIALVSPLNEGSSRIGLSIWHVSKVLLVEWDAGEPTKINVPNFRQSEWEADFLAWAKTA